MLSVIDKEKVWNACQRAIDCHGKCIQKQDKCNRSSRRGKQMLKNTQRAPLNDNVVMKNINKHDQVKHKQKRNKKSQTP